MVFSQDCDLYYAVNPGGYCIHILVFFQKSVTNLNDMYVECSSAKIVPTNMALFCPCQSDPGGPPPPPRHMAFESTHNHQSCY